MENAPNAQRPELTGNVLFYKNPQPLSAEQHGGLGVKQIPQPFGFLRESHAIPVTVTEFGMVSSCYPIIFVGEEMTPVAVMGIRQNQNLFVTDDGKTEPDYYVPAFIRRYPFVFANDNASDRLLLCVDRDAEMVTNQPEVPFFQDGQPTEFTQNAIEFCKEFERQRRATQEFTQIVKGMGLFEQKSVAFQPRDQQGNEAGPQQKIADYWAVDEEKLNGLSDEQFMELRNNGAIGAIYAHMISLLNWSRVIQRAVANPTNAAPAGAAPAAPQTPPQPQF
ncbi:MAG: SapC family protein [Henriciella sp.]|nr:SapC family protein [Henriciella sp.]